jgi:tyrosyl-tRNA synthetase
MIIASRFQRMGHRVVFIVGDITAKIGDPSGQAADRPPLTDDDIRGTMKTYREQVTPFFDFGRANFRYNSEWLAPVPLPQFLRRPSCWPRPMSVARWPACSTRTARSCASPAPAPFSSAAAP